LTDPTPRHARPDSKARAKESKTTRVVHAFPRTGLISATFRPIAERD
jgi:hypothetical protein